MQQITARCDEPIRRALPWRSWFSLNAIIWFAASPRRDATDACVEYGAYINADKATCS